MTKDLKYAYRKKGEKLLTAGLKDDRMYFIIRGKVNLSIPRDDSKIVVHRLPAKKVKEQKPGLTLDIRHTKEDWDLEEAAHNRKVFFITEKDEEVKRKD